MQGFSSRFVDTDMARHAVQLCLPAMQAAMDSREAGASGFLYIVILRPGFTPEHGSFGEAILYEHALGDPAQWDADYAHFAKGKAKLSWRTGADTHAVQQLHPHLLVDGDSLLWGGIVQHGIVVAVSGADPWFDEAFACAVASMLRALAKKKLAGQNGRPWLEVSA